MTHHNDHAFHEPQQGGDVGRLLQQHREPIIERLMEWVRIPSVAAQPERAADVIRSAHWLAGEFRELGLSTELFETGETVAVFAELRGDPSAPTVLIYSHHDVRHAKPEEWTETEPFVPVLRDGRLYGRGASDAKGQVLAHLWALRAYLERRAVGGPTLNLKFIVEGEEEMGSPHLAELLDEQKERFACDVIVFSDTLQWKMGDPAVVSSMRGMVSATLTVLGPKRDVHSGAVSGATSNPIQVLVELLSQLHDDQGRIMLPGFYDDVDEITQKRRQQLDELSFDDEVWLERTEARSMAGEQGFTAKERLWARPSLELLSLLAGDPEGIARAVIPAKAKAELNVRTVAGQSVAAVANQLRAFFADRVPSTVDYTLIVDEETGQEPYVTPEGPELAALLRASAAGHGADVAGHMGNAGGGPAELLGRVFEAPVLFVGTGLPQDHWHSSDESIEIDMMAAGAATLFHLWNELADVHAAEGAGQ